MKEKTIKLNLKDVYQLLITECRYGYSRMNHLMPSDAYEKVRRLLPEMQAVDSNYAINTAQQICSECISMNLVTHFYDGIDDEFGSRAEAIQFISWLLEFINCDSSSNWTPYNYDQYLDNLKHDNDKIYNVYEIDDLDNYTEKKFLAGPLSVKEYPNFVFKDACGDNSGGTYNKIQIKDDHNKIVGFKYRILTPIQKIYLVKHI